MTMMEHRDGTSLSVIERARHSFGRLRPSWAVLVLAAIGALSWLPMTRQFVAPAGHHHGSMMHMAAAESEPGAQAARPTTIVTPVSCERLPHVPGKSITTVTVDFPPGAHTPRHRHPGSVTAFVLKGAVRSQLLGGPAGTFSVGQTWFEPPGTVHLFAENASATEPAQLLAIFVADDDCGPLTILD